MKKDLVFLSSSESRTKQLAQKLAKFLQSGHIVALCGNLGSGKTTFVKGLAKGLKVDPKEISSPTFVLLNVYEGKLPIYHFDFYRLEDPKEIYRIGADEFIYGKGICVMEWAERLKELTPSEYLKIEFIHKGLNKREICFKPKGKIYADLIKDL